MCYSFWVLSALSILNKLEYIDADKLISFILSAQDPEAGGIADRPGDMADVFHTCFGAAGTCGSISQSKVYMMCPAGLSLVGYPGLEDLDPVYCMPARLIEGIGLRKAWKALERRSK